MIKEVRYFATFLMMQVDELASPYLLRMFGSIKIFNEVMRRFARAIERAHGNK